MATTLDDDEDLREDIDLDRLMVADEPSQARSPINLRPVVIGLVVLLLGGGLGTAAYFASTLDMGDVIGVLDVADPNYKGPRLAMEMPGRGGGPAVADGPASKGAPASPEPAAGGALLSPPGMPVPAVPGPSAAAEVPVPEPEQANVAAKPAEPAPIVVAPEPTGPRFPAAPLVRDPGPAPTFEALPARAEAATPLAPAPDKMLFRQTPDGPLPIIALDGRQPWQVYAHPFQPREGWATLAVVVSGLGMQSEATEAAIQRLPPQVTLAFNPYATGLEKQIKAARDAGHEVLVALPTEPSGYPDRDPGPWGLLTSLDPEENISRLEKVLVRLPGHVGVLAEEGPFTRSEAHLRPVLGALKDRGLMYVGGGGGEDGPPHAAVTEIADREPFREAIDARLAFVADSAKKNGRALVVSSASPVALDRLVAFLARLPGQAIRLAPATAVAIAPPAGKS